jgi:hypothetical protein
LDNYPSITISAPIRNRQTYIPYYLKHIYEIDYPKEKLSILWVLNDSIDDSEKLLNEFKNKYKNEYNFINIKTYNKCNLPEDKRNTFLRESFIYNHLANLRNFIFSKVDSDFILSIDSDILVPKNILTNLIKYDKKIIASLIYNGYEVKPKTPYLYTNAMIKFGNGYKHLSKIHIRMLEKNNESLLQKVDLTGAVILIAKEVYKNKKIKYGYHKMGEDAYFSECAKKEGYNLFIDLGTYSKHLMNDLCLEKYLNGENF